MSEGAGAAPPTRGERNNNPLNLRWRAEIAWQGLADPPQDEAGYCRFLTPGHGIRAGAKDLHTAWRAGRTNIAALIAHFAPPSENDTKAYISDVAIRMVAAPDEFLDLSERVELSDFVTAIIHHENGRCLYSPELIAASVEAALG
jgi:hypothetical protein